MQLSQASMIVCRHLKEHGYDPSSAAFQEVSQDSEETHNSSVVVGEAPSSVVL